MVEHTAEPPTRLTLLTAREAAAYLRVSLSTLRRMELQGRITALRTPGGHRRFSLEMLNTCLAQPPAPPREAGA